MLRKFSVRLPTPNSTYRVDRRMLLGSVAATLALGWAATEAVASFPGVVPGDPILAVVGLCVGLFAGVALLALT
jgi:hypothetical protein